MDSPLSTTLPFTNPANWPGQFPIGLGYRVVKFYRVHASHAVLVGSSAGAATSLVSHEIISYIYLLDLWTLQLGRFLPLLNVNHNNI